MEKGDAAAKAAIFFSCKAEKYQIKEMMLNDHALVRIISGESIVVHADSTYAFGAGDTMLIPRNQLGKVTKCPKDGAPYKSISIFFTQHFLQRYYTQHKATQVQQDMPAMKIYDKHPLLDSLFGSLLPYFTLSGELPAAIAAIKVEEAITVLRSIDKQADAILGHFEDPGKIGLADFMEKNYTFNLPMEKFGYLTGRSITTFKRDFKKVFNTTPQKWLTGKRLELAWYQILEKKRKPSDVYFEVGFENMSHFSFAFKKKYGLSPNQLIKASI